MTPLEKENAALREQLAAAVARADEAVALAVETSVQYDQAVSLATAAVGAVVAQRDGAPPAPAPAPPPAPVAPPPPIAPASFNEFLALPSTKKAELRAHFGDDLEARLYDEKMLNIQMNNSRRSFAPVSQAAGGGGHIEPAYGDYRTPLQISRDHAARMNAQIVDPRSLSENDRARLDSLNSPGSPGRRLPAPSSSVPFTPAGAPPPASRPGHKSRHLGGFGIRE